MGSQEIGTHDGWPKVKGFAPRLAGLVGCATGRKDADGNDTREAGPTQLQRISEADVAELKDALL
jgi:hypothetical protein